MKTNKYITGYSYILAEFDFYSTKVADVTWKFDKNNLELNIITDFESKEIKTTVKSGDAKAIGILIEDIRQYLESKIPEFINTYYNKSSETPSNINFLMYNLPDFKYSRKEELEFKFVKKENGDYLCIGFNNYVSDYHYFSKLIDRNKPQIEGLITYYFSCPENKNVPDKIIFELYTGQRIGCVQLLYDIFKIPKEVVVTLEEFDNYNNSLDTPIEVLIDAIYTSLRDKNALALKKLELLKTCESLINTLQWPSQDYNKSKLALYDLFYKIQALNEKFLLLCN